MEDAGNDVYGTCLHVKQYEHLARGVASIDGARVVRLARFELAVLSGSVFYPWRYSKDGKLPIDQARLKHPVSKRRMRLFKAHGVPATQPALHPSLDESVPPEMLEAFPDLGGETRLIVVAYAANADAGIIRAYWGEGELAPGRLVRLHHREELTQSLVQSKVGSTAAEESHPMGGSRRFDQGDIPVIKFPIRPTEEPEPSSEPQPDNPKDKNNEGS